MQNIYFYGSHFSDYISHYIFIMSTKAYYQKQIIDLRARVAREKEAMKRDNESYARSIRSASTPTAKASYRKSKIDKAESHKRNIESLKRQIAQAQLNKVRAPK